MAYDGIISFRPDTKANWEAYNPVLAQGEGAIETDTGNLKVGDGSSTYTSLSYYIEKKLPYSYDLSSADQSHTLPAITGAPQEEEIIWSGGGTYKLTIYQPDGTTALDYNGEGDGHIRLISDGSVWQVVDYEDTIVGTSQTVYKFLENKRMVIEGSFDETIDISTAWGSLYTAYTNAPKISYIKAFNSYKHVSYAGDTGGNSWFPMNESGVGPNDTSGFYLGVARGTSNTATNVTGTFRAEGSWA